MAELLFTCNKVNHLLSYLFQISFAVTIWILRVSVILKISFVRVTYKVMMPFSYLLHTNGGHSPKVVSLAVGKACIRLLQTANKFSKCVHKLKKA